jgi:signal transduction histidine kinase
MTRISMAEIGSGQIDAFRQTMEPTQAEIVSARAQIELERLIATVALRFINVAPDEIDATIASALHLMGEFCGADRSYVVQFADDGTTVQQTYEWCSAGVPSVMDRFRGVRITAYPWWLETLKRFEIVHVSRESQLPAEATAERDLLRALSVRSHLMVPIVSEGSLIGCLGTGSQHEEKTWEQLSICLLSRMGEVVVSALLRRRTQQRLATQYTVANILAESATFREAFPKILQAICEGAGAELGELWRVDPESNLLRWAGAWHTPSLDVGEFEAIRQDTTFSPETGLPGHVWASGRPEWLDDLCRNRFIRAAAVAKPSLRQAFAFPVRCGSAVTGVMAFYSRSVMQHDDEMLQMLDVLGSQIGNFIEHKRAEDEIRRLNVELERRVTERTAELAAANKELEAFSYSVSHDLRAPLRAIQGFSQALNDEYADRFDAQGRDYLQRVHAAGQRMGQLINDLLHLSRLTRGEMRRQPVDLSALAVAIAAELQKAQPHRRVAFLIAGGLTAHADPRLLRVALENLLGNAWKYTSKQQQARIELGVTERDGERAYFVRDDGAGFDMAYADRLFAPFQRLHTAKEFEGTGIGLATVQRIIHRHGGRIWAEGAVGNGATFYFTVHDGRRRPMKRVGRRKAAGIRRQSEVPTAHSTQFANAQLGHVRRLASDSKS